MNIVNKYLQEHEIERIQIMEQLLQKLSDNFVLKGGTSLLIGYGLDRFSEDIDLDVIDSNRSIKQELTHLKIDGKQLDFSIKKDTNTTFRVMIDYGGKKHSDLYGETPYNLKLEVSKRSRGITNNDYQIINGIKLYNIDKIISQKINAFGSRSKARDIYDIHFLLKNYKDNFSLENYRNLTEILDRRDIETLSYELANAKEEGIISGINNSFDPEKMALEIDASVSKGIEDYTNKLNRQIENESKVRLSISTPKERGGLER